MGGRLWLPEMAGLGLAEVSAALACQTRRRLFGSPPATQPLLPSSALSPLRPCSAGMVATSRAPTVRAWDARGMCKGGSGLPRAHHLPSWRHTFAAPPHGAHNLLPSPGLPPGFYYRNTFKCVAAPGAVATYEVLTVKSISENHRRGAAWEDG